MFVLTQFIGGPPPVNTYPGENVYGTGGRPFQALFGLGLKTQRGLIWKSEFFFVLNFLTKFFGTFVFYDSSAGLDAWGLIPPLKSTLS